MHTSQCRSGYLSVHWTTLSYTQPMTHGPQPAATETTISALCQSRASKTDQPALLNSTSARTVVDKHILSSSLKEWVAWDFRVFAKDKCCNYVGVSSGGLPGSSEIPQHSSVLQKHWRVKLTNVFSEATLEMYSTWHRYSTFHAYCRFHL